MEKLGVILWKELLDLSRDRKTLLATVLLPLVSMPLLALSASFFSSRQVMVIGIVVEDTSQGCLGDLCVNGSWIASTIKNQLPGSVKVVVSESMPRVFDVAVTIPEGFSENLTSLDRVAVLRITRNIGSSKAQEAYYIVSSAIYRLSRNISRMKVEYLAEAAGIPVDPGSVLRPIAEESERVLPTGKTATEKEEFRVWSARFLSFALAFIVTPPTIFITDSIAGERERKTLETLLVAPIPRSTLLTGKLAASSVLGIVAAMADAAGVVLFFTILGAHIMVDAPLLLVHAADVALTIMVTSALVVPVVSRADTSRSAQSASTVITSLALLVFFAVLMVDIPRLPTYIRMPLYLIPFTHSALIIYYYVLGYSAKTLIHAAVLVAVTAVLLALSYRLFDSEKVILGGRR